jgi:peptide/nickel transport system substrate-binding protein
MRARRPSNVVAAFIVLALLAGAASAWALIPGEDSSPPPEPPATVAPVPRHGGRLLYGIDIEPTGLDPTRNAFDYAAVQVANVLYDPLVAYEAGGRPVPYLLESLVSDAGHTRWVLKLRAGVRFHNGEPLDADALLRYVEAMRTSAIVGSAARQLTGARRVDDLTIELTTSRPWASFPVLLTGQAGYIVSTSDNAELTGYTYPIGTGPFIMRSWEIGRRMHFVRNPQYWRTGLPYLDAVDFVVVPQGLDRLAMLQRGELDATAVTNYRDIRALEDIVARGGSASRVSREVDDTQAEKTVIAFNTTRAPLDDTRVRQAIGHATDVQDIARQGLWSPDRAARGPLDPDSPYFSPAPWPAFDPDRARTLVREYLADRRVPNRPNEVTFTLLTTEVWAELANALVAQWIRAGIRARVEYTGSKVELFLAARGGFEAVVLRHFAAPDPDVLWHYVVSDTVSDGVSLNFTRLRSSTITTGMNEGRASSDDAARARAYAQVQEAMARQLPYLWLQREEWRIASAGRVRANRNVTVPDGRAARPFLAGTHRLTETWLAH